MRKKMQLSKPKQLCLLMLFLTLSVALSACGYSNPYSREDDSAPEAVAGETISIYVDMWSNNSSELGLQSEMKQALVRWLKKSRNFSMAATPDQADYVLGGVIESSHYPGLSYGAWDRAVELRAEMKYSYHLRNHPAEKKFSLAGILPGRRRCRGNRDEQTAVPATDSRQYR
jgi:hypothetical protein